MRLHEVVDAVTAEEPPLGFTVDDIVTAGRRAQHRRRVGLASAAAAGLAAVAAAAVFVLPSPSTRQTTPILPAPAATVSSGSPST